MFLEHEAKVLKTIPIAHDFHSQVPFICAIDNRLDKVRLPISDIKKHTIVFQDPQDLVS